MSTTPTNSPVVKAEPIHTFCVTRNDGRPIDIFIQTDSYCFRATHAQAAAEVLAYQENVERVTLRLVKIEKGRVIVVRSKKTGKVVRVFQTPLSKAIRQRLGEISSRIVINKI